MTVFFVVFSLLCVTDFWLLLVYSSISNRRLILLRVFGSNYIRMVFLYLGVVMCMIILYGKVRGYGEVYFVLFFFLVLPPFILFLWKIYLIIRLDFILRLGFWLVFFDVIILLYYFRILFLNFILFERGYIMYYMNLFVLRMLVLLRIYVALVFFY